MSREKDEALKEAALRYHEAPPPGKLAIRVTKPMATQRDLSLAYSPGVAAACMEIAENPDDAFRYTGKGNRVAVVSNGTAVLGLGNIGAQAAKPVMEGKVALFKKFANIDGFDIEVAETDPKKLAEIVIALEPTFGAINLEDIKAPECFEVERICKERMGIPVFHDDQHGTAIVVAAAAINAFLLAEKEISEIKLVAVGGGAAGIACLDLLSDMGLKRKNVWLFDSRGLVHEGRERVDETKARYARPADEGTLEEVIEGADMFLGLSAPGVLTKEMVAKMARDPIIFALAELARQTSSAEAAAVYRGERMVFGREYLIPKPFDPRLLGHVATAVARAAIESGVARRPVADLDAYKARLDGSVFRSAMLMKPVFEAARGSGRRIVFAEGEDERVLRAAQSMLQEGMEKPILIGRPEVIIQRIERYGLSIRPGEDVEICNPNDDPRYREYWQTYHRRLERKGVTPDLARTIMRTNTTAIAATMVYRGEADSLVCGVFGQYLWHLRYVAQMLAGLPDGYGGTLRPVGALSPVILDQGVIFIADSQVHHEPTAEEVAETAIGAARHISRFGIEPKIALCSHSVFGNLDTESARKMRRALEILDERKVSFEYEGEMNADHALDPELRSRIFPNSRLKGAANCLIFANVDAASGARNILKQLANGLEVGPILMGMGNKAHIVSPSVTARGLLNTAALASTPVKIYA